MGDSILAVRNLTKIYGREQNQVLALDHVDLDLAAGEIVMLMGPSGSGKTTLLQLLGGLEPPTEGKIKVKDGKWQNFYHEPEVSHYRRDMIGFVFQFFNLISALTAEENVALPLILAGQPKKKVTALTEEMLNLVGLSGRSKHRPAELSGGQQQRVAIARALIHKPTILLADEPTGNLDSRNSADILELLLSMRDKLGQSMLIVTHDPYVATYGDRVVLFRDGRIVDEYGAEDIIGENRSERSIYIMERLQAISNEPHRKQV
ncbi:MULTISPECIES: ABC transporter ATP-binding protein [unclassified Paenibacillus]|uniref:ABC transporter ATP-binding protein n=1 Tax=unclassified Paenibacillus TaxID=185978 RepID=UPI000CFDBDD7|nr:MULTISPECIES: ABC transporter ATP-binding protein [unclassified Paenibacillus]PRA03644.1 ABC transporter ATP-binding protein [Paenibacillus sp. MYb63]PRA47063.1 ABC transporter ATP-binding protein [Paenibacillus sp. MYb67]QZN76809.1 ABC transporter ATP-binding protein [Paenibacillus sp. DR312]